jgi:hypothetical protein
MVTQRTTEKENPTEIEVEDMFYLFGENAISYSPLNLRFQSHQLGSGIS